MDEFDRDSILEEMLNLRLRPVRKIETVLGTRTHGKERILEEQIDRTVIGEGGSIDTAVGGMAHFADCGDYLKGNLGGRCTCGAIVCSKCLRRCAVCGAPLCPPCSTVDPETGLVICHVCADEISYQRRARVIGRTLGGLFLGTNDKGKEQK